MRNAILLVLALLGTPLAALLAGTGTLHAAEESGDSKKASEHKITQSKSYMMIDPIYTTIVQDDRPGGLLMVGVGLDVPDPALRAEVTRSLPVLRDAYVRNLMAFTATHVRIDAQPDVGAIAARLQGVTDRALGKKGARILLAQVALKANEK
jgi:flagellar basal body-associated protein FliL